MSEIEKFNFEGMAEVRVLSQDGEPWFVAADVTKILGHTNGPRAVRDYVPAAHKGVTETVTPGGPQKTTIISEPGLYRLIMRSKVEGAERFQDWVTAEVLPTIRKTGGYATPGTDLHKLLSDSPLDALRMVADTATKLAEENQTLKGRIEEDSPKVLLAEEFFESDGLMGLREAARSFGMKQSEFTTMLRDWGWIDLHGTAAKANAVKQAYMENKVFVRTSGGQTVSGKLTRKGIDRISHRLRALVA